MRDRVNCLPPQRKATRKLPLLSATREAMGVDPGRGGADPAPFYRHVNPVPLWKCCGGGVLGTKKDLRHLDASPFRSSESGRRDLNPRPLDPQSGGSGAEKRRNSGRSASCVTLYPPYFAFKPTVSMDFSAQACPARVARSHRSGGDSEPGPAFDRTAGRRPASRLLADGHQGQRTRHRTGLGSRVRRRGRGSAGLRSRFDCLSALVIGEALQFSYRGVWGLRDRIHSLI